MKYVKQALLLSLPFIFVGIWQQTALSQYTIQTIAGLVLLYLLLSLRKRGQKQTLFFSDSFDMFILTAIILLLVLATGNFSSSLFFLLYFLSFGVAFVLEPINAFVYVVYASSMLIALGYVGINDITGNIIKLGSLYLIAPLAFFFGRELRQEDKEEEEIESLEDIIGESVKTIAENTESIIKEEKEINQRSIEKLDNILEETEVLREIQDKGKKTIE